MPTVSSTQNAPNVVLGIDVGGTTTKIVGFEQGAPEKRMLPPMYVQANDPVTSIYGAFGKFLTENGLELNDIECIYATGVGASVLKKDSVYGLPCTYVKEFTAGGVGGLYLSGLQDAIVASLGTGTALIHAKKTQKGYQTEYLGGIGVGGGTLTGLCHRIAGVENVADIEKLCAEGNLDKVDLRIKDLVTEKSYQGMNGDLTASNFGKVSDLATPGDFALGVANMVAETIAMVSVFAARGIGVKDVVLIGNLTAVEPIRKTLENFPKSFGVNFIIPENARFGTVIGAGLSQK